MRTTKSLMVFTLLCWIGCAPDPSEELAQLKKEVADLKALIGPPPASLDTLYPPIAEAPLLQMKMAGLNGLLATTAAQAAEGDFQRARTSFERFRAEYSEVSRLVPEWTERYPQVPVEELGTALDAEEPKQVMSAVGKVGAACHHCHVSTMVKVQQKYHWGDFSAITVADPILEQDLDFRPFKQLLNGSLASALSELAEGNRDSALRHFDEFSKRFQTLRQNCELCHQEERAYYVDASVLSLLDELGTALRSHPADSSRAGQLVQQFAERSCSRCHLVHMPAALAPAAWRQTPGASPEAMP